MHSAYSVIHKTIELLIQVGVISGKVNADKLSRMVFLELLSRENLSLLSFLRDAIQNDEKSQIVDQVQFNNLERCSNSVQFNPFELTEHEKMVLSSIFEKDVKG